MDGTMGKQIIKKNALIFLVCLILCSCITTNKKDEVKTNLLNKWIGINADEFFLIYGLPTGRINRENGYTIYQWNSEREEYFLYGAFVSVYCILNILADEKNKIVDIILVKDTVGRWQSSRFYEIFKK